MLSKFDIIKKKIKVPKEFENVYDMMFCEAKFNTVSIIARVFEVSKTRAEILKKEAKKIYKIMKAMRTK